ncbi:hypothetical protein E4T39_03654 [Aureobasidium subglaciale]|nr:hypothetical protein E4T39_03654 [Aureobasidium subglaciale]
MPPRATKKKATVPETPKRVTRGAVREGSAPPILPVLESAFTPRRGRSRSKTPESKTSSFEKPHHESQLPAVAEEEEKQTPRVTLPNPIDLAPIADASPYVTPPTYRQIAASTRKSLHESPTVSQTIQQSVEVYVHQDATEVDDDNEVEEQEAEEEAVQEAVEAQLASETAEAGLSPSHPTPLHLKTTPNTSLAGQSSTRTRTSSGRVSNRPLPSDRSAIGSSLIHSPLAQISGNAGSSPVSPLDFSKYLPAHFQRSPAFSSPTLMERSLKSEGVFGGLTDHQRTALLMDMRSEIMRLRKVEEQFLAASKQSQPVANPSPQQLAKSTSQPPAMQEPSPDVPRTVTRLKDIRYQRSIASPAKARYLAEEAERKAAAEKKAQEEEQVDQSPSRSVGDKRQSKTPQSKTPETQTPQKSSQALVVADTPAASPSWGLTSLFGSVKNIFTHRPNLSPIKQHRDQPQEQNQEQQEEHQQQQSPSERAPQRQHFTPSHLKQPKRNNFMSPQQSPTPKAKSPAPPATPAPEEIENYGETPRTTRRLGGTLGAGRRKRDTPSKPKEPNADVRAQKLEQVAQKSAERQQAEEKADRLEKERQEIQEELRKSQMQMAANYKTGNKRKVNVDDLAEIPCSDGTFSFGMVDGFYDYDSDRDFVEMDEEDIRLRSSAQQSAKRVRLDDNVFEPKTPPAQPSSTSPVKQVEAPQASLAPATPAPNYSQLTQQAIEKQRLQFTQHKPKQPSRLRNVERLSTGSSLAASSPQQAIASPLQHVQEVSPVPQLAHTPPAKVYNWPAGEELETPETWDRILKLYTPEMAAADRAYFTNGLIAAGANTPAVFTV